MSADLNRPIGEVARLTPRQKTALKKLGIETIRDMLFHFPARYEVLGEEKTIRDLSPGEKATIIGEVVSVKVEKTWKKKIRIAEGIVKDASGLLQVVWFNQPYIANLLKPGTRLRLSGKVSHNAAGLVMTNPTHDVLIDDEQALVPAASLLPIYPETYGITSRWFRYQIRRILGALGSLPDAVPQELLHKYHLPACDRALRIMHGPKNLGEAEAARKRFAFEEIFFIQINRQQMRRELEREPAWQMQKNPELVKEFAASLPFPLTNAQKKAIEQILEDFTLAHPMARLLEGDVGSGKTLVAAAAAFSVVRAGYQAAYMAPTEILARQHFDEFIRRLGPFKIRIGLLTGSEARKFPSKIKPKESAHIPRSQLLRACLNGEIQILIGTHALIEDRVTYKKLALVVVDEQHRFGVAQRRRVIKGIRPHFLSMTATPIPRTLALTMYGDLDLTVLDEMPPGREPVATQVIAPANRERTYQFIREEVARGGQVFVICPKIEDKKAEDTKGQFLSQQKLEWNEVKSVKTEFKKLGEEVFPELRIGMVHGKLTPHEKEAVMKKFKNHELDILVSTSVVEVGVDVPNASIMMIEGGERFGLAQLHQFRGRVGRGSRKSYCLVFTTSGDHENSRRLGALQKAKTGFELAEYDLEFRGAGELSGKRQWGVSDVGMEALRNIKMVEAARAEAHALVGKDPELKKYPLLRERAMQLDTAHFE